MFLLVIHIRLLLDECRNWKKITRKKLFVVFSLIRSLWSILTFFLRRLSKYAFYQKKVLLTHGSILVVKEFNCMITQSFKHVDVISSFLMFEGFFLMDGNSNLKKNTVFWSVTQFFQMGVILFKWTTRRNRNEESIATLLAGKRCTSKASANSLNIQLLDLELEQKVHIA